jgi:hypothetical protein
MNLQICNIASCFHPCTNYVHKPTQDGEFRKHYVRFIAILTYNSATKVLSVNLSNDKDVFVWNLQKSDIFSVCSLYTSIMQCGVLPSNCRLWNIKVPLKIKVFLWYLWKGVTLTKDNLAKRNWQGSLKCCFCSSIETIQHLFFDCHFAKFIWNTVYLAFGIQPPSSFSDLFGSWLNGTPRKLMSQILLGAAALC